MLLAAPAGAVATEERRTPVAVELVIAMDCSASVDREEFGLQVVGLSQAFADPDVQAAVAALKPLGVAVSVMQWGGSGEVKTVIPWAHLESGRDARAFAYVSGRIQRWYTTSITSISGAIEAGHASITGNAYEGLRRTIDVSGDGRDNGPLGLAEARQAAADDGIVINGLPIEEEDEGLTAYYRTSVIAGTGAFVEPARDSHDFVRAMRDKLLRELRPPES
ncbi:DUF1194 domain-containing protein [soil metagenome]